MFGACLVALCPCIYTRCGMETSQSPRRVLNAAYRLGLRLLPLYSSDFSRHDFTLPQLFACLVLREFYGLSYRRTEKLLADSAEWLADIGSGRGSGSQHALACLQCSSSKPDASIACLICQATHFAEAKLLQLGQKPLAMDSTCFEQHHRSAHYDRRCRQMTRQRSNDRESPGKTGELGSIGQRLTPPQRCGRCPSCRWRWRVQLSSDPGGQGADWQRLRRAGF